MYTMPKHVGHIGRISGLTGLGDPDMLCSAQRELNHQDVLQVLVVPRFRDIVSCKVQSLLYFQLVHVR